MACQRAESPLRWHVDDVGCLVARARGEKEVIVRERHVQDGVAVLTPSEIGVPRAALVGSGAAGCMCSGLHESHCAELVANGNEAIGCGRIKVSLGFQGYEEG